VKYECGFFAVNNDHCWINNHCVVCKINYNKVLPELNNVDTVEVSKGGSTLMKIKVNMIPSEYHGKVGFNDKFTFITKWLREKF